MENIGLIVAIIGTGVGIIAVSITLMLWVRGEANSDRRYFDAESKQLRRDLIDVMRAIETEFKDFHGRLCAIEERRK